MKNYKLFKNNCLDFIVNHRYISDDLLLDFWKESGNTDNLGDNAFSKSFEAMKRIEREHQKECEAKLLLLKNYKPAKKGKHYLMEKNGEIYKSTKDIYNLMKKLGKQ